ncbi:DMT family transporter [Bradyrhizobium sp. NAS80.1]|uniref:DMT family transporter n=1 Tax=Bradyrhizobium sp. NAS80.1 TaxID=1680159 RepID=UPI000B0839F1|nr:DMT family transporter [Bradyrhizobium sp. NAS80.1]
MDKATSEGGHEAVTGTAPSAAGWLGAIALIGFILVATAQASNQILARGLAGSVPPFALAFFGASSPSGLRRSRLRKFALAACRWLRTSGRPSPRAGMFLCGGPVYAAGVSTTAIHIALITALSPITVLPISSALGMEHIGPLQWLGTALALSGALLIISGGHPETLIELETASGDGLVVIAMLGWSGYTLLQSRAAPKASLLARISMFSAAGALFSLPPAVMEMWTMPAQVFSTKALSAYVFAGIVPGLLAYAGFAWLGGKFGSVRTSWCSISGRLRALCCRS